MPRSFRKVPSSKHESKPPSAAFILHVKSIPGPLESKCPKLWTRQEKRKKEEEMRLLCHEGVVIFTMFRILGLGLGS